MGHEQGLRRIEVLQHEIELFLNDSSGLRRTEPLLEGTAEHIEEMIKEGFSSGELCESLIIDDEPEECHGWWHIVKKGYNPNNSL